MEHAPQPPTGLGVCSLSALGLSRGQLQQGVNPWHLSLSQGLRPQSRSTSTSCCRKLRTQAARATPDSAPSWLVAAVSSGPLTVSFSI